LRRAGLQALLLRRLPGRREPLERIAAAVDLDDAEVTEPAHGAYAERHHGDGLRNGGSRLQSVETVDFLGQSGPAALGKGEFQARHVVILPVAQEPGARKSFPSEKTDRVVSVGQTANPSQEYLHPCRMKKLAGAFVPEPDQQLPAQNT
jgi:hypothetical protein